LQYRGDDGTWYLSSDDGPVKRSRVAPQIRSWIRWSWPVPAFVLTAVLGLIISHHSATNAPSAVHLVPSSIPTTATPTITTSASMATAHVGVAFTFTVMSTGSPTPTLSETGVLPSGITFTDNGNGMATIAGTAAQGTAGTFPITVGAANGDPPDATQSFTLTVKPSPEQYDLVGSDGGVFVFGPTGTGFYGSLPGLGVHVNNIVGIVPTGDNKGYFLVGSDGGVFAFGDAPFENSLPGLGVHVKNIVGIAGNGTSGYWVVGSDGAVYALGNAGYYGGLGGASTTPIVGIAATESGNGYWLVSNNGSVSAFGDAQSYGSLPALGVHVSNVVALVPTPDQLGYWLVGSDGGIFAFGDAQEIGSLPGLGVHVADIVGGVPAS